MGRYKGGHTSTSTGNKAAEGQIIEPADSLVRVQGSVRLVQGSVRLVQGSVSRLVQGSVRLVQGSVRLVQDPLWRPQCSGL
ncbi:hypothetical protein ACOMHN_015483 [Nucella lapillus]